MDALSGEDLVGVALAGDEAEGCMIQALLGTAGIASVLQQVGIDGRQAGIGFLNPGGGQRWVMVRSDQAGAARVLLEGRELPSEAGNWPESDTPLYAEEETEGRGPRNYGVIGAYGRIWAWSLSAMVLAFGAFLLLRMA